MNFCNLPWQIMEPRKGHLFVPGTNQKSEEPKGASEVTAEIVHMVDGLVQVRTENQVKSVGTWGNWGKSRGLDGGHSKGREQAWLDGWKNGKS